MQAHQYSVDLVWQGNQGTGTSSYRAYGRNYAIEVRGKPVLAGSSDPLFRGDPARHNPEDMLVASIASCHMLWYLHLASAAGLVVTDYRDRAQGDMTINSDGSGQFTSITLNPEVTITDASRADIAEKLHGDVGAMCFIARSVTMPIHHKATIIVEGS